MAIVLAIEPDPRQAAILKRVVRERAHAEIRVVDTKDAAIAAMGTHPPQLILLTALLSPRDEEELVAHLRTLEGADHLQTLTIPLLAPAASDGDEGRGFLRKALGKKKKSTNQSSVGCDPWTFAEEVAGYLRSAAEARAEREWHAERNTIAEARMVGGAPPIQEIAIEAPEPPTLSDAAAHAAAPEAPAPDTSVEPTVYDWPTVEAVAETLSPGPVAEAAPERILEAPAPEPEPAPVAAAPEEDEQEASAPPGREPEPEPVPEPIYLTSPDRVFDEPEIQAVPANLEPENLEPVEPVMYRPLKHLPPLATWVRAEEPAPIEAYTVTELPPERDTAGVLARLRVPAHALAVSYPRRPYIRHVRAA
jgi:CheY-like chemotaxis protein